MDISPAVTDPRRLAAVRATGLLDSPPEEAFDGLARVARTVLKAPFAFVTIVDDSRSFWKACIGVDGDARQNTVQESFCQYVIGEDGPVITGDAASTPLTKDNPSIDSMGVAAWAGFPVRAPGGEVLGTFCVVDTEVREWTADEVEALEALAEAATGEIALRASLESGAEVIRTLQKVLLPPEVPAIEGMDIHATHAPAQDGHGVLGDFYDAFETQPGRWFVAMGDVRGHGPQAAETVASVRWSIRAAAIRTTHTAHVMDSVNQLLLRRDDPDAPHMTGVLACFHTDSRHERDGAVHVDLTTAGHPPPVVRRADGSVEQLLPAGRPLGMFPDADLGIASVLLHPGDVVLLITDGVTEARSADRQLLGEAGLLRAVRAVPEPVTARGIVDATLAAARDHSDGPLRDDVALVALMVPPSDEGTPTG